MSYPWCSLIMMHEELKGGPVAKDNTLRKRRRSREARRKRQNRKRAQIDFILRKSGVGALCRVPGRDAEDDIDIVSHPRK